jgi:hypothetical protein
MDIVASVFDAAVKCVLYAMLLACYMFPSVVALLRRHCKVEGIILLNFALGWTIVGWFAALAWAGTERRGRRWFTAPGEREVTERWYVRRRPRAPRIP